MKTFKKPVDYRTDQIKAKKSETLSYAVRNGLQGENGKVTEIFTWKFIFALLLLPVLLLWRLVEYIHLLTFVIFGGLLLYFGVTGLLNNPWTDTALYLFVGTILVVAPVLFALDKDK